MRTLLLHPESTCIVSWRKRRRIAPLLLTLDHHLVHLMDPRRTSLHCWICRGRRKEVEARVPGLTERRGHRRMNLFFRRTAGPDESEPTVRSPRASRLLRYALDSTSCARCNGSAMKLRIAPRYRYGSGVDAYLEDLKSSNPVEISLTDRHVTAMDARRRVSACE